MGACVSSEPSSGDATQALVVDVQKVIADHVWHVFRQAQTSRWTKRFVKRRDFTIVVPMNCFVFEQTKQDLSVRNGSQENSKNQAEKLTEGNNADPKRKSLQTIFTNDTSEEQVYSFHFEKVRRSEAHVSYQKGFSFGGCTDFSINLPKILPGGELGAELDMHMEVTKTEEQTFGEQSVTSINSEIIVSPHSHCVANVVLEDNHITADYKVYVTMKVLNEEANISIYNKRDEMVARLSLGNLCLLFNTENCLRDATGTTRKDAVQFVVEGVLNAVQLSSQLILVDSKSLK